MIFAYHGYPWLIHRLTYRRTNHANIHVRGYKEEGTTTTPFDMVMMNDLDRYHLVMDVIDRVPGLGCAGRRPAPADGRHPAPRPRLDAGVRRGHPEVRDWSWSPAEPEGARPSRAIASSSSVGTTSTVHARDRSRLIRRARAGSSGVAALRSGSSSMPSRSRPRRLVHRTRAECSPTPAVNVRTSAPPRTAR